MATDFAKRIQIALAGYGMVILFSVAFWVLHERKELSPAERLILSAVVAAPLALPLLADASDVTVLLQGETGDL